MQMFKGLIGDTIQVTWINSGTTPSPIIAAVYNGSDTLVDSGAMTSSGNGHYYRDYTLPNTVGMYVAQTIGTINSNPYKNRVRFKAVKGEAD